MIERNINENLVNRDAPAKSLIAMFENIDAELQFNEATIYHSFPIYPDVESNDTISANVIFLSREYGIFIFQTVEDSENLDLTETEALLSEIDRLIYAKILKESPRLQKGRRNLKVEISPAIFVYKEIDGRDSDIFQTVSSEKELKALIQNSENEGLSAIEFKDLKATIEGSKGILRPADRRIRDAEDFSNSKGAILSAIENEIYTFDIEQKRSALFVIDGPQRIRGLAGSGKTVILAMKAAIIHLQNPSAKILYTYNTKALNEIVKRLITRFYRQFADKDPNWSKIHIMHAWGGRNAEGVYYNTCLANNVTPMNYSEAVSQDRFHPFDFICGELDSYNLRKTYDYTLIDEAQDFLKNFYRVCRQITHNNRVVWAYDDFQNILDVKIQNEKETFGTDNEGNFYVDFDKNERDLQDIILHKCYRNPRKILVTAFALGLGIYNKDTSGNVKIVQRLENKEHWESLGFNVLNDDCSDGSKMRIIRPENHSSEIKNKLLDDQKIIRVRAFQTMQEETDFIVASILDDIQKELNPEDISVVGMDTRHVKNYFALIEEKLNKKGLKVFNLLSASTDNKHFRVKGHVTLSTVFSAKGNEAGSVYVCGIDAVFTKKDDVVERNKIFTAMTRSLAWVTLSGMGQSVSHCANEIKELVANDFELNFIQPSESAVRTIRHEIAENQKMLNEMEKLIERLSKQGFSAEDIKERLRGKLGE